MYKDLFNEIGGQVDELRIACERQEVYYKTMISTYEVTSGQQVIQIQKLEKAVKELKVDSANRQTAMDIERKQTTYKLTEAQKVVEDNVQTILRLQMELRTVDAEVNSLYDSIDVENLEKGLAGGEEHTLTDDSFIHQYTGGTKTPVPCPYTHPIRDVPESGKVRVKNG